jgi:hypothetical protein
MTGTVVIGVALRVSVEATRDIGAATLARTPSTVPSAMLDGAVVFVRQQRGESTRRQAATCSALSANRARPSASSSITRLSAIR